MMESGGVWLSLVFGSDLRGGCCVLYEWWWRWCIARWMHSVGRGGVGVGTVCGGSEKGYGAVGGMVVGEGGTGRWSYSPEKSDDDVEDGVDRVMGRIYMIDYFFFEFAEGLKE
ncbi:hypothetical protein Tco_1415834 [Tanacetum coccineum]